MTRSHGAGLDAGAEPPEWLRTFPAEFERIRRSLLRLGVQPRDCEDLAQEVFLVMCRRWRDYDPRRPLDRWLSGIAFKVAQRYRRSSGREVLTDVAALAREAAQLEDDEDQLLQERRRRQLMTALASLPDRHRAILVLRVVDEVPMQEVARSMSVPLFTAYNRLRRARLALAKAVKRLDVRLAIVPLGSVDLGAWLRGPRVGAAGSPAPSASATIRSPWPALNPASPLGGSLSLPRRVLPALATAAALVVASAVLLGLSAGRTAARPSAAPPSPEGRDTAALRAAGAAGPRSDRWSGRAGAGVPALSPPPAPPSEADAALALGLIGHWRLDDGAGSPVARDDSGQGNDCRLRDLPPATSWTDGALDGALALDGRGWLECPRVDALAGLGGELSLSLWIRRQRPPARGIHALVSRQLGAGDQDHFFLGFDGAFLEFSSHLFRGFLARPLPAAAGRWVHLAVVRATDATMKMFVDGVEVGRRRSAGRSYGGGTSPLTIGAGINGPDGRPSEPFEGGLDEILIHGRALSDDEIAALASRRQPPRR